MYDIKKIKLWAITKATNQGLEVDGDIVDYEIERAIIYGAELRNSTVAGILAETKDYSTVLTEMVVSALTLYDKVGRTAYQENGISNQFEDGNIYQKEQTRFFVPLIRGM